MGINTDKRAAVAECGRAIGASEAALKKWMQRGVPWRWHSPLLAESRKRRLGLKEADLRPEAA